MSVASVLAAGRRSAESLMTARCKITRLKQVTFNNSTLLMSDNDPSDDVIYEGPCRLRGGLARVTTGDFEGQLLASQQIMLHLPVATSGGVQIGDTVQILDGGDDPTEAGIRVRVQGRAVQTQATAHRFPVNLITEAS